MPPTADQPVVYVKKIGEEEHRRTAHTASDRVAAEYDGYVIEENTSEKPAGSAKATGKTPS